MNVAILLLNKGRGSGVVAKEHAAYLIDQGHKVYFMHPEVANGAPGAQNLDIKLDQDILPVHENLPSAKGNQKAVSTMGYEEAIAYLPAYVNALEEIIQDLDLVIGHHANLSAIAVANVCKRHGKPYVLFLHGTGIEPRHLGEYDDKIWQLIQSSVEDANGILVTTEYVRDQLVRNLIDLPLDRFHVQACGVNTTEFNEANTGGIKEKYSLPCKYVICPGALTKLKGPQNVVEASKYYFDLAPTYFIGDGELREELESQLGDKGQFLGFVSNEDKAKLINAADLLVAAPEKKEHFGIIYIEAMSGGTPVVAYEGGGVNSIVTPEAGILTERNPKALGEAVRALLLDSQAKPSMRIAGRKRVEDLYATQVLGPHLTNWLSGIVEEHKEF